MTDLSPEAEKRLHRDLIKLGDMMGDGLHHEPDGKWIEQEYRRTAKALGYDVTRPRKNNSEAINARMATRVTEVRCQNCDGELKQTRKGSKRGRCVNCKALYQLLK